MQRLSIRSNIDKCLHFRGAMLSDPGVARVINEDHAAYILPSADDSRAQRGVIALVADGMGGHAAGEVASAIAADVIVRTFYKVKGPVNEVLEVAFHEANREIYKGAEEHPEREGMGTTCTAVVIRDGCAYLAHVGDSRFYLLRGTDLHQLSEDHSLVMDLVRAGAITADQARQSPDRNIILRALGTRPHVEACIWREGLRLQSGDILLLCSDGLTDYVDDQTIKNILLREPPLEACRALIGAALDAGGDDNVTVGVFTVSNEPPAANPVVRATRSSRVRT